MAIRWIASRFDVAVGRDLHRDCVCKNEKFRSSPLNGMMSAAGLLFYQTSV